VKLQRLDAMTARALGIAAGAELLVRPDGVPVAIGAPRSAAGGIPNRPMTVFAPSFRP
jgi:hypothetical protein